MVKVEVVYIAREGIVLHHDLELTPGSNVADALTASGIFDSHPETRDLPAGIFAKQSSMDTILKDGDRVELYRPLVCDPKEKRRQKARLRK
jgi:putative ubiquitin-RnfH superfamily antitoxin RatB of RatAB toxin-antitoxin module